MDNGLKHIVPILREAAKTTLGVFALMVLALSIVAFAVFSNASDWARVGGYALLVLGFGLLLGAMGRALPPDHKADDKARTQPEEGLSAPLSEDFCKAITGTWRLEIRQVKGPGNRPYEVQHILTITADGYAIRGSFRETYKNVPGEEFVLSGEVFHDRFIILSARPLDQTLVQFSELIFDKRNSFKAMPIKGRFVGFGSVTDDLIYGEAELWKIGDGPGISAPAPRS